MRTARQGVVASTTLHVFKSAQGVRATHSVRGRARTQVHRHGLRRGIGAVVDGVDPRTTIQTVVARATHHCVLTRACADRIATRRTQNRLRQTIGLQRRACGHLQRTSDTDTLLHQDGVRIQGVGRVTTRRSTCRPIPLQQHLIVRIAFDRHRRAQTTGARKRLGRQRQLCASTAIQVQLLDTRERRTCAQVDRGQARHIQNVCAIPTHHRQIARVVHDAVVA